MADFVLDSYALLAFFRNEDGADRVQSLLQEAAEDKHHLFISVINAGEVFYMSHRKDGLNKANKVWELMMQFPMDIIEADLDLTFAAAQIKAAYKLSFADAFAAALSIQKKATLVTGDDEFKYLASLPGFKAEFL